MDTEKKTITVETTVNAPLTTVWEIWNNPIHITHWAIGSDDWETPSAENDLRVGGSFKNVMAAKDGSAQFDFVGTYTAIAEPTRVEYDIADGRHVKNEFTETPHGVHVATTFEPYPGNPDEMERSGWQHILDTFKQYTETTWNQ